MMHTGLHDHILALAGLTWSWVNMMMPLNGFQQGLIQLMMKNFSEV